MCGLEFFFLAEYFFFAFGQKKISAKKKKAKKNISQEKKLQTTYFSEISVYQTETKYINLKEFISQRKPVHPYNII